MRSLSLTLLLLATTSWAEELSPGQEQFFEQKVRPVLAEHCWKCHGPAKQESELRLDSPQAMSRGGASGEKLIAAGDPAGSYFVKVIRREGDVKMPPETPLTDDQVASLSDWIKQGAFWPKTSTSPADLTALERVEIHRREHWAYQPVVSPPAPDIQSGTVVSPLDRFVVRNLTAKGLSLSPEADKRTLARRLSFDLTGLPPTSDEVDAFMSDDAPDA